MAVNPSSWLGRRIRHRAAEQWHLLAQRIQQGDRRSARRLRDEAQALRQDLNLFLQGSDAQTNAAGTSVQALQMPPGTDWRWRPLIFQGAMQDSSMTAPDNGQRLGEEVALWHDCANRSLILRQKINRRATDLAPYGLRLEGLGFSGSYLSLSLDLPEPAREGLDGHHILRLAATLRAERPITVYGRLNLAQGPNSETILRQLGDPVGGQRDERVVEFDLGYAELSDRPVDKLWLDLIFESPRMNAVTLSDMVMSRHARASI